MTTIPTGRFVWFEYLTPEPAKAQGFFGELYGWTKKEMPTPTGGTYTMFAAGDDTIGGYPPRMPGMPPHSHWLSHLQVTDARATVAKIKSLGGSIKLEPVDMGMGTYAVVADPHGAVFALWQPAKAEGTGDFRGKPGAFVWNELSTPDPEKASAFYAAIGGFTVEKMDMGPGGTYYLLNADGKGRAGMMKQSEGQPIAWLPYVQVASADTTSAKATKLGAKTIVPPTDIPNVGRFSIFLDSLGAANAILEPHPAAPK
jgi:predicted enzyme related to lactoylglutathione lyase